MKYDLRTAGFTVVELLVVLVIVGILASVTLPALKSARQTNIMVSAGRQLVDDISLARAKAIGERTTVHIVFVPSEIIGWVFGGNPAEAKLGERLRTGPYTTYALFAERTAGDQPGRPVLRYLTSWKSLPDGVFIATNKFVSDSTMRFTQSTESRPLEYFSLPFPTLTSPRFSLPHLAFDSSGRPIVFNVANARVVEDEVLPLARGSILYSRKADGTLDDFDVRESPPNNSVDTFHRVRVDGLTGRAHVETPNIQ